MTDLDRQKSAGKSERRKQKRGKKAEKQQSPTVAEAASAPIDALTSAEAVAAPAEPVETMAALDIAPADPVESAAVVETGPAERVASFRERMASVMPPADTAPAKPAAPAEQAAPPAPAQAVASPAAVPPPAAAPAASIQAIANAYRDFTKKSLEDAQTFAEKLSAARSIDKAVEAQTEFARQACETFADNSRKIRELHRELFWQAFRLPNWPPGRTQR